MILPLSVTLRGVIVAELPLSSLSCSSSFGTSISRATDNVTDFSDDLIMLTALKRNELRNHCNQCNQRQRH